MKSFLLAASLFLASLFGAHHTPSLETGEHSTAAVAFADGQPANSSAVAVTSTGQSTTFVAPATDAISENYAANINSAAAGQVLGTSTQVEYVTQDELNAQLNELRSLVYQLDASSTSAFTDPQIAGNGDGVLYGAVAAPAPSFSTLTVADIPDLSGNYLSTSGGTVTGAFDDTATSSSFFLGGLGIGTSTASVPLEIQDTAATSTAIIGSNIVSDGSFTSNPSGTWTLGSNWSWDSTNGRAQFSGTGGPISSTKIANGGTGYVVGDTVIISGGTGDATYTVSSVSGGAATGLTQVSAGTAYSASGSSPVSTTGGTGTGLTVLIMQIANGSTLTQPLTSSGPSDTYYSVSYNSWITGTTYEVTFTISNYSGNGKIQVDIGTVSSATQLPYWYQQNGTFYITLTSSAPTIEFTPTADFAGEISNVSVAPITPSPATVRITDSSGEPRFELRSGGTKYNTFLGVDAGRNTNGSVQGYDTAIGYDALFSNVNSWENVAIGDAALYANTVGNTNVAVGESALQYNTSGSNNIAVGFVALGSNTTGGYNTALGNYALNSNTVGGQNTAVGASALQNNLIGSQNTALGEAALYLNTVGGRDTALGWNALYSNTTGNDDTAGGYQSLLQNTTGSSDTAFGRSSLGQNTTGTNNSAVGLNALQKNTTGSSNTAFGSSALQNATTSTNNVAIGSSAMAGGTTGSLAISGANDTAVGWNALLNYIDGSNDVALGYQAMFNATTSSSSVAVGYMAGKGVSSNDAYAGLTALGYKTGQSLSNGSNFNTLIGYQAGYNITTGADNILIGSATSSNSNANLTTGSQNILIGENEKLASTTANGQLDIQNIIFGTNNTGTGSTLSTGTIGIGTTTPYSRLTVWGFDTASTSAFAVVNNASTTVFSVFDNGNATYSGSIFQSSDQRLKTDISTLDASDTLALIDELSPVSYTRLDQPETGEISASSRSKFKVSSLSSSRQLVRRRSRPTARSRLTMSALSPLSSLPSRRSRAKCRMSSQKCRALPNRSPLSK